MQDNSHRLVTHQGTTFAVPEGFAFHGRTSVTAGAAPTSLATYIHEPTGLEFVLIPGGVGDIGCRTGDTHRDRSECPRHQVHVSPFLLSRFPVTLGVWRMIMSDKDLPQPWSPYRKWIVYADDTCPVADVSAAECEEFCRRTGLELPSEAEWEYACNADVAAAAGMPLEEQAWFGDNADDIQPVGLKKPNAFGLYDMLGNVWEWCADTWHETYAGAPADSVPWVDRTSTNRVCRGGSVENSADGCRSSTRMCWPPDMTGTCTGFRSKCSLQPQNEVKRAPGIGGGAVPDGFEWAGERTDSFNGVTYTLPWIRHNPTGLELPLLPGGLYVADNLSSMWDLVLELLMEHEDYGFVNEDDTDIRELLTLLLLYGEQLYPVLTKLFLEDDESGRETAASLHAGFAQWRLDMLDEIPDAMPSAEVFAAALREDDPYIRTSAARVFGGFHEQSGPFVPELLPLLDDPEDLLLDLFNGLGCFAAEALPRVAQLAFQGANARIRSEAISTMESLVKGDFHSYISQRAIAAAIPPLAALAAGEGLTSATAAWVLFRLDQDEEEYTPPLLKALSCSDQRARCKAAWALGGIGRSSDAVLTALRKSNDDPDPAVKEAVALALWRLEKTLSTAPPRSGR